MVSSYLSRQGTEHDHGVSLANGGKYVRVGGIHGQTIEVSGLTLGGKCGWWQDEKGSREYEGVNSPHTCTCTRTSGVSSTSQRSHDELPEVQRESIGESKHPILRSPHLTPTLYNRKCLTCDKDLCAGETV